MGLPAFNSWRTSIGPPLSEQMAKQKQSVWRRGELFNRNVKTKRPIWSGAGGPGRSLKTSARQEPRDSAEHSAPLESTCETKDDFRRRVSAGTSRPHQARAKQNTTSNQLRGEASCCRGSETGRGEELGGGGDCLKGRAGGRGGGVVLVRMQKGTTGG